MTPSSLPTRPILLGMTLFALAGAALVYQSGPGLGSQSGVPGNGTLGGQGGDLGPLSMGTSALAGILSLGDLQLESGAVIDAAASPIESYLQGHVPDSGHARVRSVGSTTLAFETGSSPTVIVGDAQASTGSEVLIQRGGFVTGSIAPSAELVPLPTIPNMELEGSQDWELSRGDQDTEQSHLVFAHVTLSNDATWILVGPLDLQVRSLEVKDRARLILDASLGPIQIRIAERFHMGPKTRLQGDPGNLGRVGIFMGQGQASFADSLERVRSREQDRAQAMRDRLAGITRTVEETADESASFDWRCSGEFYGWIYAPFSKVRLPSDLRFHGALTGGSIQLEANAHATCDAQALRVWDTWTAAAN